MVWQFVGLFGSQILTLTHGLLGYTALNCAEHVEPFTVRVITLSACACVTLLPFGRAMVAGVEQLEDELEDELLLPLLLPPP